MPDSDGKLTNDEHSKIHAALLEKGARGACPACGKNHWQVMDHLISLTTFTPGVTILGGPSYPQIVLACINCGFARGHMAVIVPELLSEGSG